MQLLTRKIRLLYTYGYHNFKASPPAGSMFAANAILKGTAIFNKKYIPVTVIS